MSDISLEDRKALLITGSELERIKIALAYRELRDIISPSYAPDGDEKWQTAGVAARLFLTVLGVSRVRRLWRGATILLMVCRIWRKWNKS
ncbi:MAG: hypothetical protein LBS40_01145 [Burkholderiales bacterium]|jgi:hypothetical protein|nr:hypothetical protein [Burkholderiales bacterium]